MALNHWRGIELSDEVTHIHLIGNGFGVDRGRAYLTNNLGVETLAPVVFWKDRTVVVAGDPNESYTSARLVRASGTEVANSPGFKKPLHSVSSGNTGPFALPWILSETENDLDGIRFRGTNMDAVDKIILIDDDFPATEYLAVIVSRTPTEILVAYPTAQATPLEHAILEGVDGDDQQDIFADEYDVNRNTLDWLGWILPAVIEDWEAGRDASGEPNILLYGTGFGTTPGTVELTYNPQVPATINSWDDTVIDLKALPKTTYTDVEVRLPSGNIVTRKATASPTVTTPAPAASYIAATSDCPGNIRITGANFLDVEMIVVSTNTATLVTAYNPAININADTLNASNGISDITWTSVLVEVHSADLGGINAIGVSAYDEGGALNSTFAFPTPVTVRPVIAAPWTVTHAEVDPSGAVIRIYGHNFKTGFGAQLVENVRLVDTRNESANASIPIPLEFDVNPAAFQTGSYANGATQRFFVQWPSGYFSGIEKMYLEKNDHSICTVVTPDAPETEWTQPQAILSWRAERARQYTGGNVGLSFTPGMEIKIKGLGNHASLGLLPTLPGSAKVEISSDGGSTFTEATVERWSSSEMNIIDLDPETDYDQVKITTEGGVELLFPTPPSAIKTHSAPPVITAITSPSAGRFKYVGTNLEGLKSYGYVPGSPGLFYSGVPGDSFTFYNHPEADGIIYPTEFYQKKIFKFTDTEIEFGLDVDVDASVHTLNQGGDSPHPGSNGNWGIDIAQFTGTGNVIVSGLGDLNLDRVEPRGNGGFVMYAGAGTDFTQVDKIGIVVSGLSDGDPAGIGDATYYDPAGPDAGLNPAGATVVFNAGSIEITDPRIVVEGNWFSTTSISFTGLYISRNGISHSSRNADETLIRKTFNGALSPVGLSNSDQYVVDVSSPSAGVIQIDGGGFQSVGDAVQQVRARRVSDNALVAYSISDPRVTVVSDNRILITDGAWSGNAIRSVDVLSFSRGHSWNHQTGLSNGICLGVSTLSIS